MSYYPTNFYSNYQYGQYQQYPTIQQSQIPMQMPNQNTIVQNGLQGKIVDGEDMVKATDVPVGGYGIFPKGDFSEIYIKSWNNNGTTTVTTFKPIMETPVENKENFNDIILNKINLLEEKIDSILTAGKAAAAPTVNQVVTNIKRKEF